jgi:hypothetical protein
MQWFILTEGEPLLKRPKLKIHAPETAHLWLSLQEWLVLIFAPYLSLVELVQMKRVCKSFATHDRLGDLIALKIYSAFDGIPERHWNKMANTKQDLVLEWRHSMYLVELEFFQEHIGKFIVIIDSCSDDRATRFKMAVFSNFSKLEEYVFGPFLTRDIVYNMVYDDTSSLKGASGDIKLIRCSATRNRFPIIFYLFGQLPRRFVQELH